MCHESGCHSPHLLHHTTAAHHPWTASPIIYCTHTFPSTITPITQLSPITYLSWLSPHLHLIHTHTHLSSTLPCRHCEVLFSPVWHFWAFSPSVFPYCYLDCSHDSDHLLPAFLTLPALWYPLCLPPALTIALPLLMILPCLCLPCSLYWTLPVWPPLVSINKAALGSNYTASSLQYVWPALFS